MLKSILGQHKAHKKGRLSPGLQRRFQWGIACLHIDGFVLLHVLVGVLCG